MGTVHDFKRKPKNKSQFKGWAPVPSVDRRKRRISFPRNQRVLVALGWAVILSGVTAVALLG